MSTNRAFCASTNRAFIASANRARGCAGWEVCVCEVGDSHNFPDISLLTIPERDAIIAQQYRTAWGFNDKLAKSPWSSVVFPGTGAQSNGVSAEYIKGGDFVIDTGSSVLRTRADGQSTTVWSIHSGNIKDMCVDGISNVVIHGENTGGSTLWVTVRNLDTGVLLYLKPSPGVQIEQLVAIPVQPGGAYARTSVSGIARLDSTGSTVWFDPVEGVLNIAVDPQGNGYACGGVSKLISAQFVLTMSVRSFVRKYDMAGNLLWEWATMGQYADGPIISTELVQLQSTAVASNGTRVFVVSKYRSPAAFSDTSVVILDASTGAFIQRVDLPGDTPLAGTNSLFGINPLWVEANKVLLPVRDPGGSGAFSYIRVMQSTPQQGGPDTWSIVGSSLFQSPIKTIRPVVKLAQP